MNWSVMRRTHSFQLSGTSSTPRPGSRCSSPAPLSLMARQACHDHAHAQVRLIRHRSSRLSSGYVLMLEVETERMVLTLSCAVGKTSSVS